jgi:hypothetical protein
MKPPLMNGRSDNFQTPKEAFEYLRPFLNPKWRIWECAWGEGQLFNHIKEAGFDVIGSDKEHDFLTAQPKECDCIITNPPYSLKDEFIARCYQIGKPFALLMPLTALEGKKRQALYSKNGIALIIPNKRINFKTPSGEGSGSWFATAWFVYKIPTKEQITFVETVIL